MNKKLRPRELIWMTLPVVLLGGAAWWFDSGGQMSGLRLGNPLDPGPLRIEYTPFQPVTLSPYEVSQGYDWAAKTQISQRGTWAVIKNWTPTGSDLHSARQTRLIFRRKGIWKAVPRGVNERSVADSMRFSEDAQTTEVELKVRLDKVPRDAEEVRLRGWFERIEFYSGAMPKGFRAPKNLLITGTNRVLTLESQPFDLQIRGSNEVFPQPMVSHTPQIELLSTRWFYETQRHSFVAHLRHLENGNWQSNPVSYLSDVHIFDAKGHSVELYQNGGKGGRYIPQGAGTYNQHIFSSQMPFNEIMVPLWDSECEPRQGWFNTAFPLTLEAQFSDGKCWPLKVRTQIETGGKMKDFGAPEEALEPAR